MRPRAVHNLDEIAWQRVSRLECTTLGYLIADYVGDLEHQLAQIRERLARQVGASQTGADRQEASSSSAP